MGLLEIAYLSHPLGEAGEWILTNERGQIVYRSLEMDLVQDYLDAQISEAN